MEIDEGLKRHSPVRDAPLENLTEDLMGEKRFDFIFAL